LLFQTFVSHTFPFAAYKMAAAFNVEASVEALDKTVVVSKLEGLPDGIKIIGTHDGNMHEDEVLACASLKLLPEFADAAILRTRDQALLEKCDIVVDVGAIYDPDRSWYDHHQRDFSSVMDEIGCKTKLSSAGLVYRHYGREILGRLVGADNVSNALYRKVYTRFIEAIDGNDNGIEAFDGAQNYEVNSRLSDRVARLNCRWNEPSGDGARNARFAKAMKVTAQELVEQVDWVANCWWPARSIVIAALDMAPEVDPSRGILVLKQNCPWDQHLFELEAEFAAVGGQSVVGAAKYILYEDASGAWRVQAVPDKAGSFTSRRKLPEAWRGIKGAELDHLTGVEGGTFVHAGGFIGGNKRYEGALEMAKKALLLD